MEALFLYLLNRSLAATPLLLLVLLARWVFKRAPRWILCLLWAVVALRLICPVSFESPVGLMPSGPAVTQIQMDALLPAIAIPEAALPEVQLPPMAAVPAEAVPEQISATQVASFIWAAGVAGMLLYLLVSFLRLRHLVREAVPLGAGIWVCDGVKTPFILGFLAPKIYLPTGIRREDLAYVLAHERAHLKRKDHWWKPLGFLLLSVYWFHPLMWIGYLLMSRDIELACDEKVIQNLDRKGKKAYSTALLECCSTKRLVFACPVAFGEVAVKERIMHVLNHKKPAFWVIAVSLLVILVGTVCFMATPPQPEEVWETAVVDAVRVEPETQEEAMLTEPSSVLETVSQTSDEEWAEHPDGIRTESYTGETFTAQVMLVRNPAQILLGISSPSGFDKSIPGKRLNEVMAETGAAAAINAGKFFDDGTPSPAVGSVPVGLTYSQGACVWDEGENIPDYAGFVGFNEDHILVVSEENLSQAQAEALKIRDGCTMGPALIINGEINQDAYNKNNGYNPRTAIGQRSDGAVIFVCINGRQVESLGGQYADLIDIMAEYGAVNACNLDGGSSTTMMYWDTYGKAGEPGQVQVLTSAPMQSAPRRMPDYWLVYPLQAE